MEFDDVIQHVDPAFSDEVPTTSISHRDSSTSRSTASPAWITTPPMRRTKRSRARLRVMFSTGVTRFFPTVITGDPEKMLGALRNLAGCAGVASRRRGDGGVSRRRPAHISRGWAARRASGALGASSGYRGVSSRWQEAARRACPAGDAVAGMAGGDPLHRKACSRRSGDQHRPHRARRASRSRTRSAPARRFRRTSATARTRSCRGIRITSGSNWPRIAWLRA